MPDSASLEDITPFQVAHAYWKDLPLAEREWKQVAVKLGLPLKNNRKADIRVFNKLGRMARRWEEDGLVRHVVLRKGSEAAGRPERSPEIEEELRQRFALRHAVVVETKAIDVADEYERDNEIHKLLGNWGGRILNVCIRGEADVIGTGGGRGPYYTVRDCQFNRHVDYPRKVVSLTGRISAMDWGPQARAFLDADRVAGELANNLAIREVVRLGLDITPPGERNKYTIPTGEVTFAICGVGSWAGGHRLLNYEEFRELEPVRKELAQLKELVMRLEAKRKRPGSVPHHWVGDLCNQLFVCNPDDFPGPLSKEDLKIIHNDLEPLVQKLNAKFLSPRLEDMRDICRRGGVMAVCGGNHKVDALRHLLRRPEPVISHLVTDSSCAERILALEKAAEGTAGSL
jgi:hypothetical protein